MNVNLVRGQIIARHCTLNVMITFPRWNDHTRAFYFLNMVDSWLGGGRKTNEAVGSDKVKTSLPVSSQQRRIIQRLSVAASQRSTFIVPRVYLKHYSDRTQQGEQGS